MLQFSIAAACCTVFLISTANADEADDKRWSRQAASERERRVDDWIPVTDPSLFKRPLIGEQRPGQPDEISNLLTPPSFGKPRNLPISNQDTFFSPPKGQNSIQFSPPNNNNRPFSLGQNNAAPNFLQQGQSNSFNQQPKQQPFFSVPPSQSQQSFSFRQPPFFIPPQQSHFPVPNQPRPQFDFNSRPPQPLPPQFNSRVPPKTNTFPGVVSPVPLGALQSEKEEVQLLYVPVETLQKNKLKDAISFGKQSSEKAPAFQLSPTPQSINKDQIFLLPVEQLNQREPKQNFNSVPPQFGNPSSFQFQQIGDTKFNTGFEQNFRHPSFQSFSQPQAPPPPPPSSFNKNRFEFAPQQSAIASNGIRQSTPAFNQFVSQTPASSFTNQVQFTPVPLPTGPTNPPPHQPPLAVYMERSEKVSDILSVLKEVKTIPVLDQFEDQAPVVFVGPSSLDPPKGYVKFDLPYLSSLESNRVDRKITNLPFFVAPLNFKPPAGYSKIPFPAPHIGSVVISNATIFREALEKPTTNKFAYSSFDVTTQNTPVTSPSSPSFFEETHFNDISSVTTSPSTFQHFSPTPAFETNAPKFETSPPRYNFQDPQFTRRPTIETSPNFESQNNRFTQPPTEVKPQFNERQPELNINQQQAVVNQFTELPIEVKPQFNERQPELNVNQQQDVVKQEFGAGQTPFVEQDFNSKQQFNTQLSQEQPSLTPQFSAGIPPVSEQQTQFSSSQSEFNSKDQEFATPPPAFTQFETQRPQFESEQIRFNSNNQGRQEQTFSTQSQQPQFETQNTFGADQPQINNEQQFQSDFNAQYNVNNQQNSVSPQNNEFATQPTVPANEPSQFQYEPTTQAPVPVESTTVHIPRRRTTTPKAQQYKSSTPPPNYNPRRNRKPLYRGIPKNSGEIQPTTFPTEYNEQPRPSSDITQTNQIGTRFEETFTNRIENKYETVKPNKEYQTASETYYQPEIENTVAPVFEQKPTENSIREENNETPNTFTQQTPNYSNFQGINQFFDQVIQKEITYAPQTVPSESPTTAAPFYTVQQDVTPSSEVTPETQTLPQQSVSNDDQQYVKKPNFSEKRHRYRQKLQNTINNENTPTYDNRQKVDTTDAEKPLRNKNKYRNRQRLQGRGQFRTSTSTETTVDENIPSHFSSIRGQYENGQSQVTDNVETQSTTTEHASTKIDVGKYGTFKRRRPVKTYERTSTSTEAANVEYETTSPTVSATRAYRPRARTTVSPGERVTRHHRVRRPSTSTTPESTSVADHTEAPVRTEDNTKNDWGSYVSSFNPSAQGNDVLGSLEDQNKISKTEENAIDQYSIQRSQSYELTSPASNIDFSLNSAVTSSDQVSHSTNDQGSVSQFENRKFSAKKLHDGFVESDNTHQEGTFVNNGFDSQLDSSNAGFKAQEEIYNGEDKSALDKTTDKKAYDPATGKKNGGRRRGQWVRVRVKKPNQEYFETAESQNVANVGNAVLNPTKPSFIRLSSEEFSKLQVENKEVIKAIDSPVHDRVYFTSTTERVSTTSEDSPSKFDLEKGVSAMIAEFMNVDEDESKDNAQEIIENVEPKPSEKPVVSTYEASVENEQIIYDSPDVSNYAEQQNTTKTSDQSASLPVHIENSEKTENVPDKVENVYTPEIVSDNNGNVVKVEQSESPFQQNNDNQGENQFNVKTSGISPGAFQTEYHENYNEESEVKESQPREREIKHNVNENLNLGFSNHKYDDSKYYIPEAHDNVDIQVEKKEEKLEEIANITTTVPTPTVDQKVQENLKETASVSTDVPEITTSKSKAGSTDSEGLTEDYDVAVTTYPSLPSATTHSKVLGTSTTTEISLETEICYKGRCVKSKKKRPQYQDLFPN